MKATNSRKTAPKTQPRKLTRLEFAVLENINEIVGAVSPAVLRERATDLIYEARIAQRAEALLRRDRAAWEKFTAQGGRIRDGINGEDKHAALVEVEFPDALNARVVKAAARLKITPEQLVRVAVASAFGIP